MHEDVKKRRVLLKYWHMVADVLNKNLSKTMNFYFVKLRKCGAAYKKKIYAKAMWMVATNGIGGCCIRLVPHFWHFSLSKFENDPKVSIPII